MTSVQPQLRALLSSGELSVTAPASAYPLLPPVEPPSCVVRPGDADELQAIIRHANQVGLNLAVTSSSAPRVKGGITSQTEHVLLDLSRWRKIDLVDRDFVRGNFTTPTDYAVFVEDYLQTRQLPKELQGYLADWGVG